MQGRVNRQHLFAGSLWLADVPTGICTVVRNNQALRLWNLSPFRSCHSAWRGSGGVCSPGLCTWQTCCLCQPCCPRGTTAHISLRCGAECGHGTPQRWAEGCWAHFVLNQCGLVAAFIKGKAALDHRLIWSSGGAQLKACLREQLNSNCVLFVFYNEKC